MKNEASFDVFISYRRENGEIIGRLLYELLKKNYNVFFDHESLSSGRFDKKLLNIIENSNDVIVILTKNCFERCFNSEDWFFKEISCALNNSKNIILLMTEDFYMPSGEELLSYPEEIQNLVKYNGYRISVAYIDSIISKLYSDLKTPKKDTNSSFNSISAWKTFNSLLCEKNFTDTLPEELKLSIIQNAVSSYFDEYNSKIIHSIINNLSNKTYNIRLKFKYEIEINSEFDFKLIDIDPEKYYEMSESLSYTKCFRSGSPSETFWIAFVTNLDELDSSLHDETFFFSENLMINEEDIKRLAEMEDEEKERFFTSVMKVKININGDILRPNKVIIDKSGIFAQYEAAAFTEKQPILDVKIRFRIPQRYTNSFFYACISEPTYSPFVRFSYDEDDFNVEMIPFLNRSLSAKDTKIFDGLRELSIENEWIMPISGAIFLINKR